MPMISSNFHSTVAIGRVFPQSGELTSELYVVLNGRVDAVLEDGMTCRCPRLSPAEHETE